ncbi:MAG TPA: hypothetical protein VGL94_05130 [Ktedonobacteraceae bacterium]|jgi:hypothetical protein
MAEDKETRARWERFFWRECDITFIEGPAQKSKKTVGKVDDPAVKPSQDSKDEKA